MTDHVDMSQFIAARSDQMNADDLMDQPRTITITKVTAAPDAAEQPVSVHYEGDEGKPFKPCKTVRRIMVGVWGKDASKYVGRSMTLYRDDKVAFGGMQVGGIRVSHMSDISAEKTVALMVTRGRKAPFKILPLVQQPAPAAKSESVDPKRAKAEDWLAWFKNEMAAAENPAEVFADAGGTLERMKAQYPDLHAEAMKLAPTPAADLVTQAEAPADQPQSESEKIAGDWIAAFDGADSIMDLKALFAKSELDRQLLEEGPRGTVEQSYEGNLARLVDRNEKAKAREEREAAEQAD